MKKLDLLNKFDSEGINYKLYEHEPLFSVKESENKRGEISGIHTKNLFLKNKKNYFCLFSCEENSVIDLKKLSKGLFAGNLSFAREEYLIKYLNVNPGSVSPFGLLNDKENKVNFFLEEKLFKSNDINFHPLINTATINMKTCDFIKFIIKNKKKIYIFSLENNELIDTLC